MLSDEEAAAVVVGLVLAEQRGLRGTDGALAKITRILPDRLTRRVERLHAELKLSGEPDPAPPSSETLLLVAEAVRRKRTLLIGYERHDGTPSTREIDPFGLVVRRGCWYVSARDRASNELRTLSCRPYRICLDRRTRGPAGAGLRPRRARRADARPPAPRVEGRGARGRSTRGDRRATTAHGRRAHRGGERHTTQDERRLPRLGRRRPRRFAGRLPCHPSGGAQRPPRAASRRGWCAARTSRLRRA